MTKLKTWWKKLKYVGFGAVLGFVFTFLLIFIIGPLMPGAITNPISSFILIPTAITLLLFEISGSGDNPIGLLLAPFVNMVIGALIGFIIWKVKGK